MTDGKKRQGWQPSEKVIHLEGQRFAHLTVLSRAGTNKHGSATWNCVCDCGAQTVAIGRHLRTGNTKSCGCLNIEKRRTHGMHGTKTYRAWRDMVRRATNPNYIEAHHYSLRGIGVCDRWLKFESFLADMGVAPDGLTLERIDNDKGYSPSNCKWATRSDQNKNRRSMRGIPHGVYPSKNGKRWIAKFEIDRVSRHIGTYDTMGEAAAARKANEDKYWGSHVENHAG